jgi:hypothetical protein
MCLLREVKDDDADSSAAAPGSAADARVLPERRRAKPSRRHKIAAPKSDEPAVENNSTTVGFRHFRSRVTGHCRCELGWTGRDCSQPHAEVCAKVNKCSIFNAQQDAVSAASTLNAAASAGNNIARRSFGLLKF